MPNSAVMPGQSSDDQGDCPFFLSPTQRRCLILAAQGLTDEAIARQLNRSARTVRTHLQVARKRLGAVNTTNAVAIALSRQLISISFDAGAAPP